MAMIIKARVDKADETSVTYTVFADGISINYDKNDADNIYLEFEFENVSVLKDGKETRHFGESFSGHKFDAEDIACFLICGYVNGDLAVHVEEAADAVVSLKKDFFKDSGVTYQNRPIPEQYLLVDKILHLDAVSTEGYCYYSHYDYTAVVNDGGLVTDIDAFCFDSLTEDYKNKKLFYMSPSMQEYEQEIFAE